MNVQSEVMMDSAGQYVFSMQPSDDSDGWIGSVRHFLADQLGNLEWELMSHWQNAGTATAVDIKRAPVAISSGCVDVILDIDEESPSRTLRLAAEHYGEGLPFVSDEPMVVRDVQDDVMDTLVPTLTALNHLPSRVSASDLFENDIDDDVHVPAREFIIQLARLVVSSEEKWYAPHLSTEDHGDIEFGWWRSYKALLVSVTASSVHLLRVWGPSIHEDMEEITDPSQSELIDAWRWLHC